MQNDISRRSAGSTDCRPYYRKPVEHLRETVEIIRLVIPNWISPWRPGWSSAQTS